MDLAVYLQEIGVLRTPDIIAAFSRIDRKDFVREEDQDKIYYDGPLSIGEGQTISQPYTVAFMLELLNPKKGHVVLDAGAGSGWQAALLAKIVSDGASEGKVYAYELIPGLSAFGEKNVGKYNFIKKGAVVWQCGDASFPPKDVLFDRIIAAASLSDAIIRRNSSNHERKGTDILELLPNAWKEQLRNNGLIIAPVGDSIWRFIKHETGEFELESYPGFLFVPFRHSSDVS